MSKQTSESSRARAWRGIRALFVVVTTLLALGQIVACVPAYGYGAYYYGPGYRRYPYGYGATYYGPQPYYGPAYGYGHAVYGGPGVVVAPPPRAGVVVAPPRGGGVVVAPPRGGGVVVVPR